MKIQIKAQFLTPFIIVYFINQRYFILVASFSLLPQSEDCPFSKPQEFTCLPQLQII